MPFYIIILILPLLFIVGLAVLLLFLWLRVPWSARRMLRTGCYLLALGALLSLARIAITHAWLPASFGGVISFVLSELFLLPLAALLLTAGFLWFLVDRGDYVGVE